MVKGVTALSDEQVDRLHPGIEKLFIGLTKAPPIQIVAEVVKSKHCMAQVKKGDRIVFDPFLNLEKSTGVICPRALLPLLVQITAIWEMGSEWLHNGKTDLPIIIWRNIRCMDPGFEDGGVGGVVYTLRQEIVTP